MDVFHSKINLTKLSNLMLRINKLYLPYMSGDIVPGLHSVISKEKQIMQVLYNILLSDYTCEKQNLSGPSQ